MTENQTEAQPSIPAKSPIERKPVGGNPLIDPSVERTPTLPARPTQDADKKESEAPTCDTCEVPQKKSTSTRSKSPPSPIKIDKTQPEDFEGELATNNDLPSPRLLRRLRDTSFLTDMENHTRSRLFTVEATSHDVCSSSLSGTFSVVTARNSSDLYPKP
ncbi:hypothetical protein NXS19_004066 [Fusarium pseudograminearum]|nr:hypothetical protein NXS19_004066 [Fusarium pseudograminearum]